MIAIIDYGVGNLFSLKSSLAHLGQEAVVTADPAVIRAADRLILPGVGAFGDAMAKLEAGELHVFDVSTFTTKADDTMNSFKVDFLKVDAEGHITSYLADVDTDQAYAGDTEVVHDGYFAESEKRSAPYFDLEIDGIERLDTKM